MKNIRFRISPVTVSFCCICLLFFALPLLLHNFSQADEQTTQNLTLEEMGVLDAKNHSVDLSILPKAVGDGVTDDTVTLQALIDYAYANRLVLVLPEGTYLVSDQLIFRQQALDWKRRYYSHQLIGSTKGARPIIKLAANASAFQDTSSPVKSRPVLFFLAECEKNESTDSVCNTKQPDKARAIHFDSGIRNIEIQIDSGNPAAVGLAFPGSQYTFIEDISIKVGDGFAGLTYTPGHGTVVGNIDIEGGQYGIYNGVRVGYANNTTFTNIVLKNQSVCAIYQIASDKPNVFAGFHIEKEQTPVFCGKPNGASNVVLIDGTISVANPSNAAAVENAGVRPLSVFNVYFKNTPYAYQHDTQRIVIPEYIDNVWFHLDQIYTHDPASPKPAFVDGVISTTPNPYIGNFEQQSPPDNLLTNHSWGEADLSPDHLSTLAENADITGVCNVLSSQSRLPEGTSIAADGLVNVQPGLQHLIDNTNCSTLFLPKGRYYLENTLTLDDGTTLLGVAPKSTEFVAVPSIFDPLVATTPNSSDDPPWKPTSQVAMITTVDDPNARIDMRNIRIWIPTAPKQYDYFAAFEWKAGMQTIIKDVQPRLMYSSAIGGVAKSDVLFDGNAAGRWWGANSLANAESDPNVGKRRLLVQNVAGPLVFYNYNIEDGQASKKDSEEGWQSEFIDSQNIFVYGGKFEDNNGLRVKNSDNIGIFGLTNSEMQMQWDSGYTGGKNTVWSIINAKIGRGDFREKDAGQPTSISLDETLTIYQRGQFDRSIANFLFIPSSTPSPTATPTPTIDVPPTIDPTATPQPTVEPTTTPMATPTVTAVPTSTPTIESPPSSGLSQEAESVPLLFPFVNKTTYIQQGKLTTNPSNGGKAVYTFSVSTAGSYRVDMTVRAPSESRNSLFFMIDAEPTTANIWNIPVTQQYQTYTGTWSSKTVSFTLSAGEHELIIRGREPFTQIDSIAIVSLN